MSWLAPDDPTPCASRANPSTTLRGPPPPRGRTPRPGLDQCQDRRALGVSAGAVRRWRHAWGKGGTTALRRRQASGRPPALSPDHLAAINQALLAGAQTAGFDNDLRTLARVATVVHHTTGIHLSRSSAWRLLHRLGWTRQRPERSPKERHDQAIARWVTQEWPRIKKGRQAKRLDRLPRRIRHLPAPVVRHTWAPRGHTPILRHRLSNWKRASMAAALGYHAADPDRGARLCFHLQPDPYTSLTLIDVLTQLHSFYAGERVVLVWDRPRGPSQPHHA